MKVLNIAERNKMRIEDREEKDMVKIDFNFNCLWLLLPIGKLTDIVDETLKVFLETEEADKAADKGLSFNVHVYNEEQITPKLNAEDVISISNIMTNRLERYLVFDGKKRVGSTSPLPDKNVINKTKFNLGFLYDLNKYENRVPFFSIKFLSKDKNDKQLLKTIK